MFEACFGYYYHDEVIHYNLSTGVLHNQLNFYSQFHGGSRLDLIVSLIIKKLVMKISFSL